MPSERPSLSEHEKSPLYIGRDRLIRLTTQGILFDQRLRSVHLVASDAAPDTGVVDHYPGADEYTAVLKANALSPTLPHDVDGFRAFYDSCRDSSSQTLKTSCRPRVACFRSSASGRHLMSNLGKATPRANRGWSVRDSVHPEDRFDAFAGVESGTHDAACRDVVDREE